MDSFSKFVEFVESFPIDIIIGNKKNNPIKTIINENGFLGGLTHQELTNRKPQQRTITKNKRLFDDIKRMKIKNNGFSTNKFAVYCFVVANNCSISIKELFIPFLSIDINGLELHGTPKINIFSGDSFTCWDDIIDFKRGEVVYVGRANNLHSRIMQHYLSGNSIPNSMKLGSRTLLRKNILLYCLECDNANEIEKYIHDYYGSRFGR